MAEHDYDHEELPQESGRSFAITVLVALVALFTCDIMFRESKFSRRIDETNGLTLKARALQKWGGADVVVAGSSVVAEGLNPSAVTRRVHEKTGTNIKTFNHGVSAGGFAAAYLAARRIVTMKPSTRPRVFVHTMSPMEWACCPQNEVPSDSRWSYALRWQDIPSMMRTAPTFEEASNDLLLGAFRLLAVRTPLMDHIAKFSLPEPWVTPPDGGGGTMARVDAGTQNTRATSRAESFRGHMKKPKQYLDTKTPPAYFRAIVRELNGAGVQVGWVKNPQAPQLRAIQGDDSMCPDYDLYVDALAKELGVRLVDYRVVDWLGAEDFVDGDHLNADGAVKFSQHLADDLVIPLLAKSTATR